MKCIDVGPFRVKNLSLHQAFDLMFGEDTLRKVHGNTLSVTKWNGDQRRLSFQIDVDQVPREIRTVFCGNTLKITTKQRKFEEPSKIMVKNKIKMHFLGAEIFHVKPLFSLQRDEESDTVCITGCVEHHSILPPPLNGIAETFMVQNSRRELDRYASIVQSNFELASKEEEKSI